MKQKNIKQRLFEIMSKINHDFINEDNLVNTQQQVNTQQGLNYELKTYGDLKKLINVVKLKQKGAKLAGVGIDAILGALPFIGNAKSAFDIYKAAFSRPDTKKTNTWLDKLDVDDQVSAIVDDTVENGFLDAMANIFNSKPDNEQLNPNFDMNDEMNKYLSNRYSQRTITGFPKKN